MSKTIAIAFAVASLAGLAAAAPAQAATRSVDIHAELFADRCLDQGGLVGGANSSLTCQLPEAVIVCEFPALNSAVCEWPGVDGRIAVNRVIGMQNAQAFMGTNDEKSGLFNDGNAAFGIEPVDGDSIDIVDLPGIPVLIPVDLN